MLDLKLKTAPGPSPGAVAIALEVRRCGSPLPHARPGYTLSALLLVVLLALLLIVLLLIVLLLAALLLRLAALLLVFLLVLLTFVFLLILRLQLLARLPPALTLLAGLLRRECFLIPVELGLFPDVDLILRRGRKHVKQLLVERYGRTPALGKSIDRLFLFRSRDRYDLKTRLRKQGFFLGDFTPAGGSRFGCGY